MKKCDTKMRFKWMIPLLTAGLLITGPSIAAATAVAAAVDADPAMRPADEIAIQIRGTVTSETDQSALPGVTVVEKGTNNGTVTDLNGQYSLEVTDANAVLVFSYVGFVSQEITVGSRTEINVSLAESIDTMNEVVVTALGIEREQ